MSAADHPGRAELLSVFLRHGVKFVVIGGAAIQSHGRPYDTQDIDLTPDRDETNLLRLAAALNELECRLVTDPLDASGWVALPPTTSRLGRCSRGRSGTSLHATACSI